MKQRIGRKLYNIWAFDLESHNDPESIAMKKTSMWLSCLIDENSKMDDESSYFYSMNSFIDHLELLSNPKRKNSKESRPCKNNCIYIYNLSFEWSFILPELLKRGFKFKEKINDIDEYCYNSVSTKSVSSVWTINVKFSKAGGIILFKDLSKIYGGGLGKVAEAFALPTQKGEIDYRLNRLNNWNPTAEEKEYCFKDTRIIIDILLKMQEMNDKDFFSSASMATYAMKHLIQEGYKNTYQPYRAFRKDYPLLSQEETDFLRKGVEGGITYAPERWQFKDIKQKILHIDAHQMHPSQAYWHLFPRGHGKYFTGKPPRPIMEIACCRIRISYSGVKLHSIIKLIGYNFIDNYELVVWDFEIPTMLKCYEDLKIEYIDGYSYRTTRLPWKNFYKHNYEKRLEAKKRKDKFFTLYYKLLNNSSYGKLLEKPHNQIFANTISPDGIIDSNVKDKDFLDQEISAKYTYLPIGSAIPAYSRVMLIETALLFGYEKILYFDTDSIFVLYDKYTERVWDNKINKEDFLGGWGIEEISDGGLFVAPKRYELNIGGKAIVKAGGFNFDEYIENKAAELNIPTEEYELEYHEINIVSSAWKVRRAFRCEGGTIIDFQDKEISIQKKYQETYKKNIEENNE